MDNGTALAAYMRDNALEDVDVAVKMRSATDTVRAHRTGKRRMRKSVLEAYKRAFPGFAKYLRNGVRDGAG